MAYIYIYIFIRQWFWLSICKHMLMISAVCLRTPRVVFDRAYLRALSGDAAESGRQRRELKVNVRRLGPQACACTLMSPHGILWLDVFLAVAKGENLRKQSS